MEGIGKEGRVKRSGEAKENLCECLEGGGNRNFSLKRLAGSNQITVRFRAKEEDLSSGINNGCKNVLIWGDGSEFGQKKNPGMFFFFLVKRPKRSFSFSAER